MNVLAFGSHPDDAELGCGGSLAAHAAKGDTVTVCVLTNVGNATRVAEAQRAAHILGANLIWAGLDEGDITVDIATQTRIDAIVAATRPDVVYVHAADDTHQDHRAAAALVICAARRLGRILCYRSPSSIGFTPQVFMPLEPSHLDAKLAALGEHHTQLGDMYPVNPDVVAAQATVDGFAARVDLAEGFTTPRLVLGW